MAYKGAGTTAHNTTGL